MQIQKAMSFSKLVLGAGLGAVLASFSQAQITQSQGGYLFRAKLTKGQSLSYVVNSKMQMSGSKGAAPETKIPISLKVQDVSNNIATLKVSIGAMPGSKNGKPTETTLKVDSLGNVVEGGKGAGTASKSIMSPFSKSAIKVGQSWTADQDLPNGMGKTKTNYTLKGLKTVGGKAVAEVAVSSKATLGQGINVDTKGTLYFLVADGSLLSASMTSNVASTSSKDAQGMNMKSIVTITRK